MSHWNDKQHRVVGTELRLKYLRFGKWIWPPGWAEWVGTFRSIANEKKMPIMVYPQWISCWKWPILIHFAWFRDDLGRNHLSQSAEKSRTMGLRTIDAQPQAAVHLVICRNDSVWLLWWYPIQPLKNSKLPKIGWPNSRWRGPGSEGNPRGVHEQRQEPSLPHAENDGFWTVGIHDW